MGNNKKDRKLTLPENYEERSRPGHVNNPGGNNNNDKNKNK